MAVEHVLKSIIGFYIWQYLLVSHALFYTSHEICEQYNKFLVQGNKCTKVVRQLCSFLCLVWVYLRNRIICIYAQSPKVAQWIHIRKKFCIKIKIWYSYLLFKRISVFIVAFIQKSPRIALYRRHFWFFNNKYMYMFHTWQIQTIIFRR